MAKVVVSPTVHSFSDIRPSSRALTITPRPASGKWTRYRTLDRRPSSNIYGAESDGTVSRGVEGKALSSAFDISTGRRDLSVLSLVSPKSPDPNLSFIEIESQLRDRIRVNFGNLGQAFQTFDVEKNLSVTQSEFRRALESFCFPLTQEQFEQLIRKIGANRDGTVSYMEFLEKYHQRGGTIPDSLRWLGGLHRFNQTKSLKDVTMDDIESQLRKKIGGQLQSILKALRLFDYNRDGQIQKHKLKRVIENFCFRLTDDQFNKLWCKYDMVRNGHTLQYMDFLQRLGVNIKPEIQKRPAHSKNHQSVKLMAVNSNQRFSQGDKQSPPVISVKDVELKLRKQMIANHSLILRAFVAFDRRGDGFVTLDELKRVLFNFAFPMSDRLFEELMDSCGLRANHKISYQQFLEKFQMPVTNGNGQTLPIKPNHRYNPVREADDMPTTEDIWKLLHSRIRNNFSSVKQAFLVFDDNKDGRITKRDFRRVLESFCFRMSRQQFHELMAKIDPDKKGFVSYLDFLDRFEERETEEAHPWLTNDHSVKSISPPAVIAWSTVEDILRDKITDSWKTIASAYLSAEKNRDGSISRDGLKQLIEKYCLPISEDHFDLMWSRCDENSDGTIDFQEFLSKLGIDIIGGDINGLSTRIHDESKAKASFMKQDQATRLEVAEERTLGLAGQISANECMEILKDYISQRSPDFRKTFVKFDGDGDGKISRKEFRMVLDSLGLYTSDDQFRIMSARLGFHKGKLSYMDFLENFQDRRSFGWNERHVTEYPNRRYNLPVTQEESMKASDVESRLKTKLRESFQLTPDEMNIFSSLRTFQSFGETCQKYVAQFWYNVVRNLHCKNDLRMAFQKIDYDRNGFVTRPEFRRILDSFMFLLSDEEFNKLMLSLGVQKGAKLNYREFLKRFQQVETVENGHPWLYSNHSFNETRDLNYLTAEQADDILKQKAWEQNEDLAKAFLSFDRDGNGVVTKKELRKVLYRYQIPLTKEDFKKLWKKYDTDDNGVVDYREVLEKLGGELAPGDTHGPSSLITEQSKEVMENFYKNQQDMHQVATWNQAQAVTFLSALEVEQRLRDRFRDGYENLRKAFEAIDSNRDGYISKNELQKVLFHFHYFLDDVQLNILLDRCALSGKNKLSYKKFLDTFQENTRAGCGRVSLDTPGKVPSPVVFETHDSLPEDEAINKLRIEISQKREIIRRAFASFDRDSLGFITKEDLHQIINAFCFVMSDRQFQALLKKVNIGERGLIFYEDFLSSFQKSDAEASRRWLESLYPLSDQRQKTGINTTRQPHAMTEADMEKKVREVVVARFYSLAKAFTDQDPNNKGTISAQTLHDILNEHVFRMTSGQFIHLCNKVPKTLDGTVDYREFLKLFSTRAEVSRTTSDTPLHSRGGRASRDLAVMPPSSPVRVSSPESVSPPLSANDVERKIKDEICCRWQNIQKSFRNVDSNNKGTVNFAQFKDVLWRHHIYVGPNELLALWRKHVIDEKGGIVYKDFMRHFVLRIKSADGGWLTRPKLQPSKIPTSPGIMSDCLIELMATLRAQVQRDWKEMRRAFRALDKTASGSCNLIEFRQMMRKFKIDFNEEEFFHLFSFYDKNMTGKISYNDFLRAHLE